MDGSSFYPAFQLVGPFTASATNAAEWLPTVLYPPSAVVMFVPFVFLPALAWWVVPLGVLGWSVWRMRPGPWGIVAIGLVLLYPGTWTLLVWGNATMLLGAILALGLRWPLFAPWVLMKPTLAPFALPGIRSRQWWAGAAWLAVVSILLAGMWTDWLTSIGNATNSVLTYSLYQFPFMAIPVIARSTRARQVDTGIGFGRGSRHSVLQPAGGPGSIG